MKAKQTDQQRKEASRQRVAAKHARHMAVLDRQAIAEAVEREVRLLREAVEAAKPWWKFW